MIEKIILSLNIIIELKTIQKIWKIRKNYRLIQNFTLIDLLVDRNYFYKNKNYKFRIQKN